MIHLLFEQSGTFKNEFKKLGLDAEDFDILNDFGETDHIVDLFNEIEIGYKRERERAFLTNSKRANLLWHSFPVFVFLPKHI